MLDTAAQKANWGKAMPAGTAQGIAIAESYGSIVAEVAEVAVSKQGEVRVERVVCAIDCGHVVNPLTVAEQIEGSVVWGLTPPCTGRSLSKTAAWWKAISTTIPCSVSTPCRRSRRIWRSPAATSGVASASRACPRGASGVSRDLQITGKRIRSLPLRSTI